MQIFTCEVAVSTVGSVQVWLMRKIATMVIAGNRDPLNSYAYIIARNKDYMTVVQLFI